MNDENNLFNEKQKIDIYSAGNVILSALVMGILEIVPMFSDWVAGIIVVTIGIILVFINNVKKYELIKNKNVVSFKRAVIIDGILLTVAFLLNWANVFIPDPFTWDGFINAKHSYDYHFGAIIIGAILTIPTILTNKKIRSAIL